MQNHNLKCRIINFKKYGKVVFLPVFLIFCFFASLSISAETSPDAIAIRVISNPDYYSPDRWYAEKGFSGSPQSLTIDGFEAVRDGRTVYVNAANMVDSNGDGSLDKMYTNIYLMSYTQDSESATVDIFGQALSHWKFLTNITGTGVCNNTTATACA